MFDQALRVEWACTQACLGCWDEEVTLIVEEMCHIPEFFEYQASQWEARPGNRSIGSTISPTLWDGLQSYANKQARLYQALGQTFQAQWAPALHEGTDNSCTPLSHRDIQLGQPPGSEVDVHDDEEEDVYGDA